MGRFRTALATISVGALLATGHGAGADAATPLTDEPAAAAGTSPIGPTGNSGSTGSTGNTGNTGTTGTGNGGSNKGNSGNGGKKNQNSGKQTGRNTGKKPSRNSTQTTDPSQGSSESPAEVVPDSDSPLSAEITTDPTFGLSGDSTPVAACDGSTGPPRNLIPIYVEAAKKYGLGERGPQILAAINSVETDFGRLNEVTSSAGAVGWMQFMPSTWDMYATDGDGDGKTDPYNPHDAIHAAARYLQAAGAPGDWYDAIWAYNHADWYVQDVLDRAACYGVLEDTTQVEEELKTYVCKASDARVLEIPNYYMRGFEDAASRYGLGQRGIWVLAAVARLESDYGRGMSPKQLRETGPMGLSREEWKKYGVDGDGDGFVERDEPWDGIATFARMLWSEPTLEAGLFAHNHATWYVQAAIDDAGRIAGDCDTSKTDWNIAYPITTNSTEINWDNLQILNPAAQNDIQNGLIDQRVVNLLAILTQKYSLLISALRSDHSMMTASGNVSNHYEGRAMDIAAVNGVPCTDQSESSPCTEVIKLLASLPDGVKPTELIYGWDVDGPGPAFALADHNNHIHAGFGP